MTARPLVRIGPAIAVAAAIVIAYLSRDSLDAARGWLAVVAVSLWLVVLAGALHECDALPAFARSAWLRRGLDVVVARNTTSSSSARSSVVDCPEPAALAARLAEHVIGQPEACDDVAELLRAGLAKTRRTGPVGMLLLLGPPNSGKTWLAEVVDRTLFGSGATCVVELHHYDAHSAAAHVFGEARTHASTGRRGILIDALRERSSRVVVLAEFHKAGTDVQQRLLRACGDGHLVDPVDGTRIDIRDVVFVLTLSDVPRDLLSRATAWRDQPDRGSSSWKQALQTFLSPTLLARIDRFIAFRPMTLGDLSRVTARRLETFIREFDIDVESIDAQLLHDAILESRSPGGDPREAACRIRQRLAMPLVELKRQGVGKVRLVDKQGTLTVVPA